MFGLIRKINMENNGCVIGYGTVGHATAHALGITKYYSRSHHTVTLQEAARCKYIFICLPTPTINGINYVDDIEDTIEEILSYGNNKSLFIIRSTVYPGFNRTLQKRFGIDRFISNPEFLSEDTAKQDAMQPDLIVIGADNVDYAQTLSALYLSRFKYSPVYITDSLTAELIKYTLNTFFTTKVIFANAIYDYAQKIGANYETVRTVLEKHPWGSKNHFKVWYKKKRGVHGKCLPKDTKAFAHLTNSDFFKMLILENERINNE